MFTCEKHGVILYGSECLNCKKDDTVSKSVSVTGSAPKPRHRLCWWCNLQFRGNHFETRTIDGHERQIHKRCAKLHDDGIEPNWDMV